jgi:TolA-binding protein
MSKLSRMQTVSLEFDDVPEERSVQRHRYTHMQQVDKMQQQIAELQAQMAAMNEHQRLMDWVSAKTFELQELIQSGVITSKDQIHEALIKMATTYYPVDLHTQQYLYTFVMNVLFKDEFEMHKRTLARLEQSVSEIAHAEKESTLRAVDRLDDLMKTMTEAGIGVPLRIQRPKYVLREA